MCKLGDIIVVNKFKNENGKIISKHSFVVINDEPNFIEGFKYDFTSNMMCSFHNEEHKSKKLKYEENLEIKSNEIIGKTINNKEGYIKADQIYYFDKNKIEYKVFAHIEPELLDELVKLIIKLHDKNKLKIITTNIEDKEVCA